MSNQILIKYPGILPSPQLDTHNLKQQSNLLRTKMDSGHSRVRRRFKSVPTIMESSWNFTSSESSAFEGFIVHALNAGTSWFLMNILTPSGLVEHEVRFITSPMEDYKPLSLNLWEYKAKIEIKKRAIISEEQTIDALLSPKTTTQFTSGLKNAINSYQE